MFIVCLVRPYADRKGIDRRMLFLRSFEINIIKPKQRHIGSTKIVFAVFAVQLLHV